MPELGRLITAMVTPFAADGAVDTRRAQGLALDLLGSGSDGVVVAGTTGESPTLTAQEKVKLFADVKKAVGGRGAVIAGAGTNSTAASIELSKGAEAAGADALLLVVPYYNKPPQEGLYQHFSAIARSTRLPCILYNVPGRTATNLAPSTVIRLSDIPNIAGIKEASGNLDQIAAIIGGVGRRDFHVWSGNDGDTYEVLRRGGYGVVAVASHLVGRQIKQMIELCVKGDFAAAKQLHDRLQPLFRDLFIVSNPIPVKYALDRLGYAVGGFRLPLTGPDETSAAKVMETVGRYSIDLPLPAASRG